MFELKCLKCDEKITYTQVKKDEYGNKQVDEKGDKIDVILYNGASGFVIKCACGNEIGEDW